MKTELATAVAVAGHPRPVPEFRFHPTRKWRFDLAWPALKIACEYEGIHSAKSRHTSVTGFTGDCEKYSRAAIAGWCVIRVTAAMVRSGVALELLLEALESRS